MRKELIKDGLHNLVRVDIRQARKLHEKGIRLTVVPYNLAYQSPWYSDIWLYAEDDFEKFLNEFCYYNSSLNGNHNPKFYANAAELN